VAWSLTLDEYGEALSGPTLRWTFSMHGQAYSVQLSEADAAAIARLLAPYLDRAYPLRGEATEMSRVRRWARANGYRVADRGRVSESVLHAFNDANRLQVRDPWAGRRARSVTMQEIESIKESEKRSGKGIATRVWVVDELGDLRPYRPELLDRPPTSSSLRAVSAPLDAERQPFRWPDGKRS
jgi:hypothetical protein